MDECYLLPFHHTVAGEQHMVGAHVGNVMPIEGCKKMPKFDHDTLLVQSESQFMVRYSALPLWAVFYLVPSGLKPSKKILINLQVLWQFCQPGQ